MKYKLKIIPQDGGYIGYALLNDEVAYTTAFNKDSSAVSKELSMFVTKQPLSSIVHKPTGLVEDIKKTTSTSVTQTNSTPRKCCGRG